MRRIVALSSVVMLVVGCGGGSDGGEDGLACVDLFAEGAPAPTPDESGGYPCDDDGRSTIVVSVSFECDDGRVLHQTDYGWWLEGETVLAPRENTFDEIANVCAGA